MPRKKKQPDPPLPENAESLLHIDSKTKIPLMELEPLEERMLWLHKETKQKRKKARKKNTQKNFIEQNPTLAKIKLVYLKTCLCYNMRTESSLLRSGISHTQFYKLRRDDEVDQVFSKWENNHLDMAGVHANVAIRDGNTKVALRELYKRDPRYQQNNEQTHAQAIGNQMVNIFLSVSDETKHLLMKKYSWLPDNSQKNNNEPSTWWSTQPEARWFLSPNS